MLMLYPPGTLRASRSAPVSELPLPREQLMAAPAVARTPTAKSALKLVDLRIIFVQPRVLQRILNRLEQIVEVTSPTVWHVDQDVQPQRASQRW